MFDFNFPDWVRVFSEFRIWRELGCVSINSSTIWHNAKNSYHSLLFTNAVSSGNAIFFLRRAALVVWVLLFLRRLVVVAGVLLSLKSLICLLGCLLAFFEELLCMLCYLLLTSSKVYFACRVAWLAER